MSILANTGAVQPWSTHKIRYSYTGREWDNDTKLNHFRARTYEPKLGRFLSRDPLGYVDGKSLYRGYFGLRGMDPFGFTSWRTTVVGKTFIADIDKFGGIGIDPTFFLYESGNLGEAFGGVYVYIPGAEISFLIPYPSDWFRGIATDLLFNLKEDPLNDAKDGKYRLYSHLALEFSCCKGNLEIDTSKPRVDLDGGAEISIPGHYALGTHNYGFLVGTTLTMVWVPEIPIVFGTIDMDKFYYERIDQSSMRFSYRVFGRPNILAEPSFQLVKSRRSRYIWHHVEVLVSCDGDKGFHSTRFIDVSAFPSHRLWTNGNFQDERMQGPVSLLWKSKPDELEFVIGRLN